MLLQLHQHTLHIRKDVGGGLYYERAHNRVRRTEAVWQSHFESLKIRDVGAATATR